MKRLILLSSLVLSLTFVAQTKVNFKDGKQYTISGEIIGSSFSYELDNPTQITKKTDYYLSEKNGAYQLTIFTTWQTTGMEGRLDEMRVYQFALNQLDANPEVRDETDDNEKVINYSLRLVAKEETPFQYDVYDYYSAAPKSTKTYRYITIYNDSKEALTVLSEKLTLPELEPSAE